MKSDHNQKKKDSSSQRSPLFYASVTALTLGLLGGVYGVLRPANVPGLRALYHSYSERILEPYYQEQTQETVRSITGYIEGHDDRETIVTQFNEAEQTLDQMLSDGSISQYTQGTNYDALSVEAQQQLRDECKNYLLSESLSSNYNAHHIDIIKGVGIIPLPYQEAEDAGMEIYPITRDIQLEIGKLPFAEFMERFNDYQVDLGNGTGEMERYSGDERLYPELIYDFHITSLFPIAISLYDEHGVTDFRFTALANEVGYDSVDQALRRQGSRIYDDYMEQFGQAAEQFERKRFRIDAIDQIADRY